MNSNQFFSQRGYHKTEKKYTNKRNHIKYKLLVVILVILIDKKMIWLPYQSLLLQLLSVNEVSVKNQNHFS